MLHDFHLIDISDFQYYLVAVFYKVDQLIGEIEFFFVNQVDRTENVAVFFDFLPFNFPQQCIGFCRKRIEVLSGYKTRKQSD